MSENEKLEKLESLRMYFSDVENSLSNAGDLINELKGTIEPDDVRSYLGRLTGFMNNLSSDMEQFVSNLLEGEPASFNFMFPVGLDPKSLFFSDEK